MPSHLSARFDPHAPLLPAGVAEGLYILCRGCIGRRSGSGGSGSGGASNTTDATADVFGNIRLCATRSSNRGPRWLLEGLACLLPSRRTSPDAHIRPHRPVAKNARRSLHAAAQHCIHITPIGMPRSWKLNLENELSTRQAALKTRVHVAALSRVATLFPRAVCFVFSFAFGFRFGIWGLVLTSFQIHLNPTSSWQSNTCRATQKRRKYRRGSYIQKTLRCSYSGFTSTLCIF